MTVKTILAALFSVALITASHAAPIQWKTYIERGDDKIEYSGSKEGLRAVLVGILSVKSEKPVKIYSESNFTVKNGDREFELHAKSNNHTFEIANGYHRFVVLSTDPGIKNYAVTATRSLARAVKEFVDILYVK